MADEYTKDGYLILRTITPQSSAEKSRQRQHEERLERKNKDGSYSNESYREEHFNPETESFNPAGRPYEELSSVEQSTARQQHERGVTDEDYRNRVFGEGVSPELLQNRLNRSNLERPDANESDQEKLDRLESNLNFLKNLPESSVAKIHNSFDFGAGVEQFTQTSLAGDSGGSDIAPLLDRLAYLESRVTHPVV